MEWGDDRDCHQDHWCEVEWIPLTVSGREIWKNRHLWRYHDGMIYEIVMRQLCPIHDSREEGRYHQLYDLQDIQADR